MTKKVIRDGKVAVLVSHGFGAGWSTWSNCHEQEEVCLFHPAFVAWVEGGKKGDIEEIATKITGDEYFSCGGADGLTIHWLPVGQQFRIDEYDGAETLVYLPNDDYHTA